VRSSAAGRRAPISHPARAGVTGVLKTFLGLSASVMTTIYVGAFAPDGAPPRAPPARPPAPCRRGSARLACLGSRSARGDAGATFLLFVGLFPVALAVLMIPFLNYVPFEEAIARSWFTSGAALAGGPGGLCSHAGRGLCACVCARRLQQRPRACCVRAQRLLTDADLAGVEHIARLCKRDARARTRTFGRVGRSARLGKI